MSLLGQYYYVLDKNHHRANADGSVYLHIVRAEEKLGRRLLPEEFVHHRDRNKLNNDYDNLMVFATGADHSRFHAYDCDESLLSVNENGAYVCEKQIILCIDCGKPVTRRAVRCPVCKSLHERRVARPTVDELVNILVSLNGNFSAASRYFGVSDNAIRKWCDTYNISRKSKDYLVR